jgi:hypothetical protein
MVMTAILGTGIFNTEGDNNIIAMFDGYIL